MPTHVLTTAVCSPYGSVPSVASLSDDVATWVTVGVRVRVRVRVSYPYP